MFFPLYSGIILIFAGSVLKIVFSDIETQLLVVLEIAEKLVDIIFVNECLTASEHVLEEAGELGMSEGGEAAMSKANRAKKRQEWLALGEELVMLGMTDEQEAGLSEQVRSSMAG